MVAFSDVKEKVTFSDAIKLLSLTLTEGEKDGQPVYRGKCPTCKSGGDRALVVTPAKGFYCFAKKAGGDVIALTAHIRGIDVKAAAEWLTTPTKGQVVSASTPGLKPLDYLDPKHEKVLEIVTEETAHYFGMGYAPKGIMRGTVAVPLHDPDGNLIAYVGLEDPYRVPAGFLKTQHIFNAHRITDGEVYLLPTVEDVLRAMENGIDNAVCFLVTGIDPVQLHLLADLLETKQARLIL